MDLRRKMNLSFVDHSDKKNVNRMRGKFVRCSVQEQDRNECAKKWETEFSRDDCFVYFWILNKKKKTNSSKYFRMDETCDRMNALQNNFYTFYSQNRRDPRIITAVSNPSDTLTQPQNFNYFLKSFVCMCCEFTYIYGD